MLYKFVYYVELTYINIVMNKYSKWYKQITDRGQCRVLSAYTEIHHIIPRSLGGGDERENITVLTAREHFICHWLLTKIYATGEEHWKMLNALRIMRAENNKQTRYKTKITSRVYEKLKREYAVLQSERMKGENNGFFGKQHTDETKLRISLANTGENNGAKLPEARKKISEKKRGTKRGEFSAEWIENLSKNHKSRKENFNGTLSEETKRKIGDKIRGRKQTPEEKLARSLSMLGKKQNKKLCPHCGLEVAVNTYPRWHGDNCRARV